MLEKIELAKELPQQGEVSLAAATGLLPLLADRWDRDALLARLRIHDPVIRVWTVERLLSQHSGDIPGDAMSIALRMAGRSGHIRQTLIPVLLRSFQFPQAKAVRDLQEKRGAQSAVLRAQLMDAQFHNRHAEQLKCLENLYIDTGQYEYVTEATEVARSNLGVEDSIKWHLRVLFTNTKLPSGDHILQLLKKFEREDARPDLAVIAKLTENMPKAQMARAFALAQLMFWRGEYERCLNFMESSNAMALTRERHPVFVTLAAACCEKLGRYPEAAKFYQEQNNLLRKEELPPSRFIEGVKQRAKLDVGQLPRDTHDNYLIMTGFPRSGTTLLENALSAHPSIATCEETSSLLGSTHIAYNGWIKQDPERKNLNLRAAFHRGLYYTNLRRHVDKPDARVVIDKTPIISANIKYMEKIFPTKRYIFSIRHPYDVVLSNWKQDYRQNVAMSAFNEIHTACELYNFVMSEWFDVFPGETDRVYYVKYDELVTDFERVMRGALDFLGVEWTDEVTRFAEHSAKRAVRTPSYGKVRQGLKLGVQSSWQNYEFLFDDRCRALLDPWTKRFGYAAP